MFNKLLILIIFLVPLPRAMAQTHELSNSHILEIGTAMEKDDRGKRTSTIGEYGGYLDLVSKAITEKINPNLSQKLYGYAAVRAEEYYIFSQLFIQKDKVVQFFGSERNARTIREKKKLLGLYAFNIRLDDAGIYYVDSFKRIDESSEYEPTIHGSKIGCYTYYFPVLTIDLNGDGVNEIVLISGKANGLNDGVLESHDLSIWKSDMSERLYKTNIKYDNYTSHLRNLSVVGNSFGAARFDEHGALLIPAKPGIRNITKLFFGKLLDDNSVNLFVWGKKYESSKFYGGEQTINWELKDQGFKLIRIHDGLIFEKVDLKKEELDEIINRNSLVWESGFPSQNICNNID